MLDQLARFAVAFALSPSAVECFRAVQLGSPVLTAILTTFGNATTDYAMEETSSPVSPASPTRRRRNFPHPSQREKKQAARNKGFIAIDPKPFKELNIEVPVNKDEADALTQKILLDQRNFLEVCASEVIMLMFLKPFLNGLSNIFLCYEIRVYSTSLNLYTYRLLCQNQSQGQSPRHQSSTGLIS